MKLTISFDEVCGLVKTRYNKDVTLSRVSDREVCVSVSQKVIIKTIQINLNLKVEQVSNESVLLSYNGGFGIDLIISGVMTFIKAKLPEYGAFVEAHDGHRLKIYIGKAKKLQNILDKITLRDISFTDKTTVIDFAMKQ